MKPLLVLLFIFSLSHADIQITEIFRAETPEELEVALVDGYPMPWLAEVLADSTIPEEDRYWLDCRMRAVIAQDLHLFFDEDGNPVRIDADWISPGETYWRENFIVNHTGIDSDLDEASIPTGRWGGSGSIVNRFGMETGQLAICPLPIGNSYMSRGGSIAVTFSGIQDSNFGPGLMNLCYLRSNGSFFEYPIHGWRIYHEMSQSGALVAVSCRDERRSSSETGVWEHKLLVLDREGHLLFEHALPYRPVSGIAHPVISPDDRYIAVPLSPRQLRVFDSHTGEELFSFDGLTGNNLRFSPDSRLLCISCSSAGAAIIDCLTGDALWSTDERLRRLACSDSASVICGADEEGRIKIITGDTETLVAYSLKSPEPSFSPSSEFLLIQQDLMADRDWDTGLLPCIVVRIKAGE